MNVLLLKLVSKDWYDQHKFALESFIIISFLFNKCPNLLKNIYDKSIEFNFNLIIRNNKLINSINCNYYYENIDNIDDKVDSIVKYEEISEISGKNNDFVVKTKKGEYDSKKINGCITRSKLLEKLGWDETKVTMRFWLFGAVLAWIGIFLTTFQW